MSFKVKTSLQCPPKKKNKNERATTLKHNPMEEYRSSVYRAQSDKADTRLLAPYSWFKAALSRTAIDTAGSSRAEVGRKCQIQGEWISIYGTPQMAMHVVRMADAARTPDIRTRAILPEWCCRVVVEFVALDFTENLIATLMSYAGRLRGVGGWRPEKGSGRYGQFEIVEEGDKLFRTIQEQGREAQDAALLQPEFYDTEAAELFAAHEAYVAERKNCNSLAVEDSVHGDGEEEEEEQPV